MAFAPRYIPADSLVEVTIRTTGGQPLLRPTALLTSAVEAVLARALFLFAVQLHAFVYMSTHIHMLLTVQHAELLARFLRYINRNVSVEVKRLTGHEGPVFQPRPHYAIVIGDDAALARLRYICANGTKEGLVAFPTEWPGASSALPLLEQRDRMVRWASADDRRTARRQGEDPGSTGTEYPLTLTPLPALARMSVERRREFFATMYAEIAEEARVARDGRPVVGRQRLLDEAPVVTCELVERRGPCVHASTPEEERTFFEERACFYAEFRAASRRRAAGDLNAAFPPGSIRSPGPIVPWPAPAELAAARRRGRRSRAPVSAGGDGGARAP